MMICNPAKAKRDNEMKTIINIPLRYHHSLRASFTLPIVRKAVQPQLFPFSSKKLTNKGSKCELEQLQAR